MVFAEVESTPDFPKKEKEILVWWQKEGIVKKYLRKNSQARQRFSFLDGPITANNPMGVHHAWGRTLKDLFQRYKNMRGFRQRFQNGFDNQGLWVEVEVEKKLGFKSKKDIEKFGMAKFVQECKEHTLKFAEIQTAQSQRLGYFMEWDNSYYTMSDENNYMIWHFLKRCHQKGWLYKGRDSVPWCPRCGTAISQHEILTEEYRELTHRTVVFKLPLTGRKKEYLLAWTTTPWTIPGNVAAAIDPNLSYWQMTNGKGEKIILVNPSSMRGEEEEASLVRKLGLVKGWRKIGEFKGSQLTHLVYEGPYDHLPAVKKALGTYQHGVIAADPQILTVNPAEGTGIVHIAPGAGSEDFKIGQKEGLPVIEELDETGSFIKGFGPLSGMGVAEASLAILTDLQKKGFVFKIFDYTHRYPTCWRCKTELVWRVTDEWYIGMDELRAKMMKVTKKIRWIPEFGLKRELDWLKNMSDWLISKKRYWGLALPVYECGECNNFEVIGSREELKKRAILGWEEFKGHSPHRPWIDKVKIKCSDCGQTVSRTPDVGNPWLDAGIVPFSTLVDRKTKLVSYTNNKKYWREWFPADFITEAFPGQYKNWFYSLLAMSTVLEETEPFKTVLGHALVKDEKGEEMHKSKGNAIWFEEAAEKMGVDIMRWMYASQNPAIDLKFGFATAAEIRRRFFLILWNVYKFFITYARLDGWRPRKRQETALSPLDKWILSRLNNVITVSTDSLDDFNTHTIPHLLEEFVVQELSTWYVRRSRERVGPTVTDQKDKTAFYATIYCVLTNLIKLMAPITPFLTESIWQNIKGKDEPVSIHLMDWPGVQGLVRDKKLEAQMDLVRAVTEKGRSARKALQIKTRQPLPTLTYEACFRVSKALEKLIKDELNVHKIDFKACSQQEEEVRVKLDTRLTEALILEGCAREIVRGIQALRAEAKLSFDERVVIGWETESVLIQKAMAKHQAWIKEKTLAQLTPVVWVRPTFQDRLKIDDQVVIIALKKV